MKLEVIVKAMVFGTIACSISATGIAADVIAQQNIQDTNKHDAVKSNWMDRTDIKVGTQSKMGLIGQKVCVKTLITLDIF